MCNVLVPVRFFECRERAVEAEATEWRKPSPEQLQIPKAKQIVMQKTKYKESLSQPEWHPPPLGLQLCLIYWNWNCPWRSHSEEAWIQICAWLTIWKNTFQTHSSQLLARTNLLIRHSGNVAFPQTKVGTLGDIKPTFCKAKRQWSSVHSPNRTIGL